MTYLDLNVCDPEEYEGKLVAWNGCDYRIGPYLGSGAERIVHKLINLRSGLCVHVLKILRNSAGLDYKPSEIRAKLTASRSAAFDFARIIPVSIEIELPGGKAEMQVYFGPWADENTPTETLLSQGDRLLKQSDFARAIKFYRQALELSPDHTVALLNMGAALAAMDDPAGAYEAAAKAEQIEPNFLPYKRACIVYLAQMELIWMALQAFQEAEDQFPNVHDLKDVGAQLYIACGKPAIAQVCADKCLLAGAEADDLKAAIRSALKAKSDAWPIVAQARALFEEGKPTAQLVAALEEAHSIDQRDPVLAMNYGFALARAGKCREAIALLLHAARALPPALSKTCFANAAFCAIQERLRSEAMGFLALAMGQLMLETGGEEPTDLVNALPGRGGWGEEDRLLEESLPTAARMVVQALAEFSEEGSIPDGALQLGDLYSRALASHR